MKNFLIKIISFFKKDYFIIRISFGSGGKKYFYGYNDCIVPSRKDAFPFSISKIAEQKAWDIAGDINNSVVIEIMHKDTK